jgi:hypothetical protein
VEADVTTETRPGFGLPLSGRSGVDGCGAGPAEKICSDDQALMER